MSQHEKEHEAWVDDHIAWSDQHAIWDVDHLRVEAAVKKLQWLVADHERLMAEVDTEMEEHQEKIEKHMEALDDGESDPELESAHTEGGVHHRQMKEKHEALATAHTRIMTIVQQIEALRGDEAR
jgi:predicted  nucleic acid-binding Zn-ribbon protein